MCSSNPSAAHLSKHIENVGFHVAMGYVDTQCTSFSVGSEIVKVLDTGRVSRVHAGRTNAPNLNFDP